MNVPAPPERASKGGGLGDSGGAASEGARSGGAEAERGTAVPGAPAPPLTEGVVIATVEEGQVDIKVSIPLTGENFAHLLAFASMPGLVGATWTGSPPIERGR